MKIGHSTFLSNISGEVKFLGKFYYVDGHLYPRHHTILIFDFTRNVAHLKNKLWKQNELIMFLNNSSSNKNSFHCLHLFVALEKTVHRSDQRDGSRYVRVRP